VCILSFGGGGCSASRSPVDVYQGFGRKYYFLLQDQMSSNKPTIGQTDLCLSRFLQNFYQTTRCHIQASSSLHSHSPDNVRHYTKTTPWPESASELYRPSDRRLSAKLVPTLADRGCCVVSVTDPYGRNLRCLDRSNYFSFQVAPQLYSRG
jgi:hypothetical protein